MKTAALTCDQNDGWSIVIEVVIVSSRLRGRGVCGGQEIHGVLHGEY